MAAIPTLTYKSDVSGVRVHLDRLIPSRMLIQANSGGGKSRAVRQLLEETFGKVQHLVIDPEGEFSTLREKFDYVHAMPRGGDVVATPKTAKLLCRRLVEIGASAILDIYDLPVQPFNERREFVKLFLNELMALPRSLWRPVIVVIDEIHNFAPQNGESQSTDAIVALATQGRKRGFCLVGATQRISKLHKDAAAELLNKMIGRTGLDVDVKRAGEELGFDKDARTGLKRLEPGQFYVYGPAIANEVQIVWTGKVATTHPEPGKLAATTAPTPAKVRSMLSQLADLPQAADEEARSVADLEKQVKQLRGDLQRAQRGVGLVDHATMASQIDAAVNAARTGWTRDLKRIVAKDLATLGGSIDKAKAFVSRSETMLTDVAAAFLALDGTLSPSGELAPNVDRSTRPVAAPAIARTPASPRLVAAVADGLTNPQQRMLDALASFEAIGIKQLAKSHVAVYSDQSSRSSGFRNNLSVLSSKGLIHRVDSETVKLSDDGRAIASGVSAPASLEELHDAWMAKLTGPQRLMLSLLIANRHEGVERDDLAKQSGQSPTSSGYRNNLSVLSSLGLTSKSAGMIHPSDLLFPEGL